MLDTMIDQLAAAVEYRVGFKACYNHDSKVRLDFEDGSAWEGLIYVFDLQGHPTIHRAYAWPSVGATRQANRTRRRRPAGANLRDVHVVLHLPSIASAKDAARRILGGRNKRLATSALISADECRLRRT